MASWAKNYTDVPRDVLETAQEIHVQERTLTLKFEDQSLKINYREALPPDGGAPKLNLFFLHGGTFSSQTWQDIGTLQLVAALGYRAVAIDLPGKGKSSSATIHNRGAMIIQLVTELNVLKPVLICASSSGRYALPAVLKPSEGTCDDHFSGFIPIAPGDTSSFSTNDYEHCKLRTMIVYGERDHGAPVDTLHQMPNSEVFMMRNAGHACYMNDTPEWHRLLYNFLQRLCQ